MIPQVSGPRRDWLIVAGLAVLVIILGYWRLVPEVCGAFHDDGIYVITAKALAQGQGYRLIWLPQAPLQTKYPILYPALLAIIWKFWPGFPANLALMKWFSLVCGAAALGLFYRYLTRFDYFSRPLAAGAALVCATSPVFLYFSTQTLTEIPFALLVILALWALESPLAAPSSSTPRQFALGVILALPFLCRTIGVTLVAAGLVSQYLRRRPLRWLALGLAAVTLPWIIWMVWGWGGWNRDPITGYYTDYLSWWTAMDWAAAPLLLGRNLVNILISSAMVTLEGITHYMTAIAPWARIVLLLFLGSLPFLTLFGGLRPPRPLPLFLVAYLGLVLLWPWHPFRFLVPILPFLLAYLFQGLATACRSRQVPAVYVLPAILALLLAANLSLLYQYSRNNAKFHYPQAVLIKNPPSWTSYKEIFHWLRAHSRPDDVIASMEDPMIFLYTGRRALRPFKISPGFIGFGDNPQGYGSAPDLLHTLAARKVRYLVQVPVFAFDRDRINALITAARRHRPDYLKLVYTGRDQRFRVFELARTRPTLARHPPGSPP